MARQTKRSRRAAAVLGLLLAATVAAPASADVTVSPPSQPAGGSGVITFRVTDDIPDAGTTGFELDLPADHPLLGVVPAAKFGWNMAVERSPLPGPTAGRVTRVIWTAASTTTAIQPGHLANFSIGVRKFPSDTSVVRIRALQTWSNGEVLAWFDPLVPGDPTPLHPAPQIRLTTGGPTPGTPEPSADAAATTSPPPSAGLPQVSAAPAAAAPSAAPPPAARRWAADEVDIALALAAGAVLLALIAITMAGMALSRRSREPARPDRG